MIHFDELVNFGDRYPNWQDGEYKALQEWMQEKGRQVKPLMRDNGHSVVVEVIR